MLENLWKNKVFYFGKRIGLCYNVRFNASSTPGEVILGIPKAFNSLNSSSLIRKGVGICKKSQIPLIRKIYANTVG